MGDQRAHQTANAAYFSHGGRGGHKTLKEYVETQTRSANYLSHMMKQQHRSGGTLRTQLEALRNINSDTASYRNARTIEKV